MKKALLVAGAIGALGFYACKKDDKTITVTETVNDTIINTIFPNGQVDPNTLSEAITVAYGTKVGDSLLPAASTDAAAPKLDSMYERIYTAVKGRYLILTPPGLSGSVTGYYFQIAGARSYYKTSYPAIDNDLRKQAVANARFEGDNADSVIVVKLPMDIKGDTFSVKYAAYDAQGRVSNTLTAVISLLPQGNQAFQDSLAGTWTYYGKKTHSLNNDIQRVGAKLSATDDIEADTLGGWASNMYRCDDDKLIEDGAGTLQIKYYYSRYTMTLAFGNGTSAKSTRYDEHRLDLSNSTCSNLVYIKTPNNPYVEKTDFAFDAATRTLYMIQSSSNVGMYYYKKHIEELSANRLVLTRDWSENADDLYIETELFTR